MRQEITPYKIDLSNPPPELIRPAIDFVSPEYAPYYKYRADKQALILTKKIDIHELAAFYKLNPVEFIEDLMFTSDPRLETSRLPFLLYPFQVKYIEWLHERYTKQEPGVVEKCRDVGASWGGVGFSVWLWSFFEEKNIGWCSQKEKNLDSIGNLSSVFEKIRYIIRLLPRVFRPPILKFEKHLLFSRIINPTNGSAIIGEIGKNAGRSGRCAMYFKDESAHYENALLVEAALSQTSKCKIDISTPNGYGTEFYRKRFSGEYPLFIMDWRDDPRKDEAWYAEQKRLYPPMIVAQEVDRDHLRSKDDILFTVDWVRAAIEIGKLNLEYSGLIFAGLDVAYEGKDSSVLIIRKGFKMLHMFCWQGKTPNETARKALGLCIQYNVDIFNYDAIGMGAGVEGELIFIEKARKEEGLQPLHIKTYGVSVGLPKDGEKILTRGLKINERYANLKIQLYWALRERFIKSYEYLHSEIDVDLDDLIAIDDNQELIEELYTITYEVTSNGKFKVTSKKDMKKSPDRADALTLAFYNPQKSVKMVIL